MGLRSFTPETSVLLSAPYHRSRGTLRPINVIGLNPTFLPLPGPLRECVFVERPNRFLVHVRLPGKTGVVPAHLADPGRLRELLLPGVRMWIRASPGAHRKTQWSAVLVQAPSGSGLVSLNTTLPNRLVGRALERRALPEFDGYRLDRAEFPHGRSRFDFLLHGRSTKLVLEVKSVTLVEEGVARFPDAITARGARHVRELAALAGEDGWEAAVLFVLQRGDADRIEAARAIDPGFAEALAEAKAAGVQVLGRRCTVTLEGVTLGERVVVC